MYRGDPLVINDLIQVRQPTLGEIADFGEERYFQMLSAICGSPSDFMVALDDMGIRYEEITDFQLFLMLTRNLTPDDTRILTEHDREYMLAKERRAAKYARRPPHFESVLFPLISALCNHEGFKYNPDTVWDVRIFVFYDSLKRTQKITEARQLTAGLYAGTLDKKSISDDALNWLGNLS